MKAEVTGGLKACPFCGSEGVAVVGSFVRCGNCGATGPFAISTEEAVQKWNERVQPPELGAHPPVGDEAPSR